MKNEIYGKIGVCVVIIFFVVSTLSVGMVYSSETPSEKDFIVLVQKRGLNIESWSTSGIQVLADYDAFILVRTGDEGIDRLTVEGYSMEVLHNHDFVSLHSHSFNVKDGEPEIPANLRIGAYPDNGYYIVQFIGPIKTQWQEELVDTGVRLHEFRNRFNFIVEMERSTLERVKALDFINWVGIYQPAYKFHESMLNEVGIQEVEIHMFGTPDGIQGVYNMVDDGILHISADRVTARVSSEQIMELADLQEVKYILPFHSEHRFFNEHATWITETNIYENRKITDGGVIGKGQIITIMDSELYMVGGGHDMWSDPHWNPIGDTHRKVQANYVPFGSPGELGLGPYHGTHVVGTALGDIPSYEHYDMYDGNAIGARLIFQDIGMEGSLFAHPPPDMYYEAYGRSYYEGSLIHSNSWGDSPGSGYQIEAVTADTFIWDHKNYTILYAMGNYGPDHTSLTTQAEGKNVISVGGVQNFPNQEHMYLSSSRGYAQDGRIKPTILHVGHNVHSASRSTSLYQSRTGTSMATPGIAGQAAQVRQYYEDGWYPTGIADSRDGFDPSNALIRATLINGAVEINGDGAYLNDQRFPNGDQGFGRSLLDRVLYFEGDARKLIVFDSLNERVSLDTGESWSMEFVVPDQHIHDLEVTLVWSDYPGTPGANPAIVNDLDLELITPSRTKYVGNAYTGFNPGHSEADPTTNPWNGPRTDEWDGLNVEENILLLPHQVEHGTYAINVYAHQVPHGPQPFAVVITGDVISPIDTPGDPPEVFIHNPSGGEVFYPGDQAEITLTTTMGTDTITHVDTWYSIDSGNSWNILETDLDPWGTFEWDIPNYNSTHCVIYARAYDSVGRRGDDTSGTFTILGNPPLSPSRLDVELYGKHTLVLLDDFQDGDYSTDPNWTVYDGSWWVGDSGSHRWLEGQGQISTPSTQIFGRWEWDFQLASTSFGQSINFYLLQDQPEPDEITCSGYYVSVRSEGFGNGFIELYRSDSGVPDTLTSIKWTPNTNWYTLAVERDLGGMFTVYLNGYPIDTPVHDLNYMISTHTGLRQIGDNHRISEVRKSIELTTEHNKVNWRASIDDPAEVSHYNIYRSTDPSGIYSFVSSVTADGSLDYQYLDEFMGTYDDEIWWYIVRAVGKNGMEEQNDISVQEPFNINLYAGGPSDGWNFVSYNLEHITNNPEEILGSIAGSYERVMYYDASSGEWLSYMLGRAGIFNNLNTWDHSMGVWIKMTSDASLIISGGPIHSTDIDLYPGWNMVGLPSSTAGNHGLPAEVDKIGYFHGDADYNLAYDLSPGTFIFEPGKAYWIHNPTNETLAWIVDY